MGGAASGKAIFLTRPPCSNGDLPILEAVTKILRRR
jgi:hypothetical protein